MPMPPTHALFQRNIHIRVLDTENVTLIPDLIVDRFRPYMEITIPPKITLDIKDGDDYINNIQMARADFERYLGPEDGGPLFIYRLKRI